MIEEGKRPNPGSEMVSALAKALGVSIDFLVNGAGTQPPAEEIKASIERAVRSRGQGAA